MKIQTEKTRESGEQETRFSSGTVSLEFQNICVIFPIGEVIDTIWMAASISSSAVQQQKTSW